MSTPDWHEVDETYLSLECEEGQLAIVQLAASGWTADFASGSAFPRMPPEACKEEAIAFAELAVVERLRKLANALEKRASKRAEKFHRLPPIGKYWVLG